MSDYYTEDLSQFGFRELKMASDLLKAYTDDPNSINASDGIKLAMNRYSGNVFLTDEDYRSYMLNGDKLEEWLNCPECGWEGFQEEFKDNKDNCQECKRIYKQGYFSDGEIDDDEDNTESDQ